MRWKKPFPFFFVCDHVPPLYGCSWLFSSLQSSRSLTKLFSKGKCWGWRSERDGVHEECMLLMNCLSPQTWFYSPCTDWRKQTLSMKDRVLQVGIPDVNLHMCARAAVRDIVLPWVCSNPCISVSLCDFVFSVNVRSRNSDNKINIWT